MKKIIKKIFIFSFLVMSISLITSCKKTKEGVSFDKYVEGLTSYKVKGTLETYFPTGKKESDITVYYTSPDLYRVELLTPNSLEKQIILKNNEGVNILIPSINKNFAISSDWPNTSSYPYLLSSLAKDIASDADKTITKQDGKIIYKTKAKIFDNSLDCYQNIIVDEKTKKPIEVLIYKEENQLISKFVVSYFEENPKLDSTLFQNNITMETLKTLYDENSITFDRALSYPAYCPEGLVLKEEVTTGDKDTRKTLLTYGGSSYLTIIEKYINESDELKTEYTSGDIFVMGGICAIVNETTIMFYENGIEYILASVNTSKYEMAQIGDSLRSEIEK